MTAAKLARRWRTRVHVAYPLVHVSPADPIVLDLCEALLDGKPVDEEVRAAALDGAEYYDESVVMDLARALLSVCVEAGLDLLPDRLLAIVQQTHSQACAAASIASQLRDPLTGLDAAGNFLSQMWLTTRRSGGPTILVVVRAAPETGLLREMTSAITMSSALSRCPELLTMTVLPGGGVGLGCLREGHRAVLKRLETLAPQMTISSYAVPSTSLDEFTWWLVSDAQLPELAANGPLGTRLAPVPVEHSADHSQPSPRELPTASRTASSAPAAAQWHVSSRVVVAAMLLLTASAVPWLIGDNTTTLLVSDISQLVTATTASILAWRTSRWSKGRMLGSWRAISGACGAWAAGQLIWTWLDVVDHGQVPYPSAADIGFVLFPVGAIVCLLSFPGGGGRRLLTLNAAASIAALVAIYWSIAGSGYAVTSTGWKLLLDFMYPIADILLVALAYLRVSGPTRFRVPLFLLASGASAIGIADAGFASRQVGGYATGHVQDLCWTLGFALMAVAALAGEHLGRADTSIGFEPVPTQPAAAKMMTYLPLAVAGGIVAVRSTIGHRVGPVELAMLIVSTAALLALQWRQVRENQGLLLLLRAREAQLARQAFSDPLTGLPNRYLFVDRLQHALHLHSRDGRPVGVLLCSLEGSRLVVDEHGRPGLDQVVTQLADLLLGMLTTGDTLARFGDEEFAVLIEGGVSSSAVAQRALRAVEQGPFRLNRTTMKLGLSVGAVEVASTDRTPTVSELIAAADAALSASKHRWGKANPVPHPARELSGSHAR